MNTMQAYHICRLCLGGGRTLADIFDENGKLSFVEGYIEELLQFRVEKDLRLPWLICSTCLGKLNDFQRFKINSIECKVTFEYRFLRDDLEPSNAETDPEIKEEVEEENVELNASLNDNEWTHNEELLHLDVKPSSSNIPPQVEGENEEADASLDVKINNEWTHKEESLDLDDMDVKPSSLTLAPQIMAGGDEMSVVLSMGQHNTEKSSLEHTECAQFVIEMKPPMGDLKPIVGCMSNMQSGDYIRPFVPNNEPDGTTTSKCVRRSLRVRCRSDHSNFDNVVMEKRCRQRSVRRKLTKGLSCDSSCSLPKHVDDRGAEDKMPTVGRDDISRLEAKVLDSKERIERQQILGCDAKGHQGKQKREGEGVSDETLLPQGIEAEDVEISNWIHTKKTLHETASKASLTEEQREKRREYSRKYYHSLNEEKRKSLNMCRNESKRMRLSLMTDEERKEFHRRKNEAQKRHRSMLTEEERKEFYRCSNEAKKRRLSLMTEEERKEYYRSKNEALRRRRSMMTKEERKEFYRCSYEAHKKRLSLMTEEKRKEFYRHKHNKRIERNIALMSDEESEKWHKTRGKVSVNILPP